MNCKDIIATWLEEHGYDGLCYCGDDDGCGCGLGDDFMPCYPDGFVPDCEPAYRDDTRDGWYKDKAKEKP